MLRGWLPQAESYLLPDATHLLMIVRPRQVAEALASFSVRSARARPR